MAKGGPFRPADGITAPLRERRRITSYRSRGGDGGVSIRGRDVGAPASTRARVLVVVTLGTMVTTGLIMALSRAPSLNEIGILLTIFTEQCSFSGVSIVFSVVGETKWKKRNTRLPRLKPVFSGD